MRSRIGAGVVALALCAPGVSGCAPSANNEIGLCSGDLARVEVYNYFGDHGAADHQTIENASDLDGLCDYVWAHLGVKSRTFTESELGQRSVTVLAMSFTDGTTRTVWVDRLAGFQAGVALLFSSGESYFLPTQDLQPYYLATSEPISRDRVPKR